MKNTSVNYMNKHIQTMIAKEEHLALKIEAAENDIPLQVLLRQIIINHLKQKENKNG